MLELQLLITKLCELTIAAKLEKNILEKLLPCVDG